MSFCSCHFLGVLRLNLRNPGAPARCPLVLFFFTPPVILVLLGTPVEANDFTSLVGQGGQATLLCWERGPSR